MEIILSSIIAFAVTNIDDLFILMLFFGDKKLRRKDIVFGQYSGIMAILSISIVGSLLGLLIEKSYIGILGLLPFCMGIWGLIKLIVQKFEDSSPGVPVTSKKGVLKVASVTLANGADNIGIYIPLLAAYSLTEKIITISIFLMMVGVWCVAGSYLSQHQLVAQKISKYGHIITPLVLTILGLYIMYESGTVKLFTVF